MLVLNDDTVLALSDSVVLQSIPDQGWYFAFDVKSGNQYSLNHSSYWILDAIGSSERWDTLLRRFLGTFDVASEEGESDLREILAEYFEQKIVRRLADGPQRDPA